jgi:hypothetical protein
MHPNVSGGAFPDHELPDHSSVQRGYNLTAATLSALGFDFA